MIEIENKKDCCGCKACANACPKQCIHFEIDEEVFSYPKVDTSICVNCHLCEKVCPSLVKSPLRAKKPSAYGAKIKDEDIRDKSSSGGLFSAFANKILNDNGVVYGVAMSEDLKSAHNIRVDNKNDLAKLRGSKYLQSNTENIYIQVKKDLVDGRKVLFSGVPCQINALKMYLRKEYDNLYCMEVICHGTPSPALWKKYLEHLEVKYNAKIESVDFRNKKYGWKRFGLVKKGKNINQYLDQNTDPYMVMFLRDYCLRPSCYDCNAKKLESMADITVADFWGIENVLPEMDDNTGTSLVLVQNEKGKELLTSVNDEIEIKEVGFDEAIKCNPSYFKAVARPKERDTFFVDMNNMSFAELQNKYCKVGKKQKIKSIIKKTLTYRLCRRICRGGVNPKFAYGLLITMNKK